MPKPLCKQSKELIASLITYFEREGDNGGPLLPMTAVRERVANALNLTISISAVSSVSTTVKSNELLRSPKRKRPRKKSIVDIDDFDQVAVRNVVYEMYQNKQHVTRQSLLSILAERDIFKGNINSLGKILKNIGFRWKRDDPRRGLMELQRIAVRRVDFLQQYMRNVNSDGPLPFVYIDETWIFENGSVGRSWQDDDRKSVKRIKSDEKRYIIVHAGNKRGFIPGASLIFSSKTNVPDYHGEMNQLNFMKWFENQLLKNLNEPSIIIMDNASYHSGVSEKTPNSVWRKADIQNWLCNHNILFSTDLLKTQLLSLVAQNRPPKKYFASNMDSQRVISVGTKGMSRTLITGCYAKIMQQAVLL